MSRTRTRTFVLVSALVLCLASIFVGAYADSKDTEPAENPVIRESAYPAGASSVVAAGGPYIVATTYNPGTASLDDDVIVLVYNTDINPASVSADPSDDFTSTLGTDLSVLTPSVSGNVIRLAIPNPNISGFADGATQWIAMKPGEIADVFDILNTDVSEISIGVGPVIVRAEIFGRADDLTSDTGPDNNTVTVTFDAPVSLVGTANAAFGGACPLGTTEFNNATLSALVAGTDITLSWSSGNHFLFMQPGVMNVRLASGQVTWTAVNRPNGSIAYRETLNDGPLFTAAWYNRVDPTDANDDVIAAVFDQVVTNVDPVNPWTTYFNYTGSADLVGGVAELWYSTAMTNIVRVRNFSTDDTSAISGSVVAMDAGINNTLQDFQNLRARFTSTDDVVLHYGPGIVRASYSNGMRADDCNAPDDHSDDELVLYLSEDLSQPNLVTGPDGRLYFRTDGFDLPANIGISYTPGSLGQFPRIVFRDFHSATNFYEQGDRIGIADPTIPDPDLTPLVGSSTGDPLYAAGLPWLPVLDESRPTQVALSDLHDQVLDNAVRVGPVGDSLYIGFLRFNEAVANGGVSGREDGDQYFLYAVQRNQQGSWDKDKMATYINNAIPIGNLRPRMIDGTTRLAIPIAVGEAAVDPGPGPYQPNRTTYLHRTADNTDIRSINNLVFLLASADWQGNMSRIETLNPDEFGWTWLDVTFHPPTPDLRVYVQEPYCTSGPALPGQIRLYGIHWIHDYEVDRVRFEYLKENAPGNRCDTDAGESWLPLGTVGGVQNPAARGDAIQYRNNSDQGCRADLASLEADYVNPQGDAQPGISHVFSYDADSTWYMYYDADNDGIYSSRDAVVIEMAHAVNPVFDDGVDPVVIGSDDYIENIPDGVPLAYFVNYDTDGIGNPAYYWAESAIPCGPTSVLGDLDPGDYIFRENFENYVDGVEDTYRGVNLWRIDWAPCENLEDQGNGNYIVRTIAIDRNDNEDIIQQHCYEDSPQDWNSIEIRPLVVNCDQITCALSGVDAYVPNYNEGTDTWGWTITHLDLDGTPPDIDLVPQNTKFIKVTAAPDSPEGVTDLQFYLKHGTWRQIGRAANNEAYADLNGLPGFQHNDDADEFGRKSYAPYLDDERFYDVNGNFIYDDGETCVDFGRNGTVDTPVGMLLIPVADDGSETSAPYFAYFDLSGFQTPGSQIDSLRVDVNHERPACPAGTVANSCLGAIELRNWTPPIMTGPVRVETEDNAVVDVFHPVSDGDPYVILGPDPTPATSRTFLMHVTAEDFDNLRWVRVWYRPNPACTDYADRDVWKLVHAANMDTLPDGTPWDQYPDKTYPWSFHWQVHEQGLDLTDSNWQFYAEAMDLAGNLSYAPVYPYGFGFHDWAGMDLAYVTDPVGPATPQCDPSENVVNIGDSKTFTAVLDPSFTGEAQVRFYFAPRIQGAAYLGTDLDADHVLTLDKTILDPENGGLVVCVDDLPVSRGSYYTANAGDDFITFLTIPAAEAAITVNYNFIDTIHTGPGLNDYEDGWLLIAQGDNVAPFTVEWADGPQGGVPDPSDPDGGLGDLNWTGANAYDIIARALIDVDGDGVYDAASMCDMKEPLVSEKGNHLMLRTVARPIVHLYGLDYEPTSGFHYPQQDFWPGNPFGLARLGTDEDKGSGIENDVFITAGTEDATAEIASVTLKLFKSFESDPYATFDLDVVADRYSGVKPLSMLMTMYAADYYEVRTDEIENVQLWIHAGMGGPWETLPMTKFGTGLDAYYQVAYPNFMPGGTYEYRFFIDKIGDDDQDYADRRNMSPAREPLSKVDDYLSLVVLPQDFYYKQLLETDFQGSGAYRALVEVADTKGMTATNIVDGNAPDSQGPILFMHDLLPPVIQNFWAEHGGVVPAAPSSIDVHLETADGPDSIDVIKTRTVVFQYSPNKQDGVTPPTPDEWITFKIDRSTMGGWNGTLEFGGAGFDPPTTDAYDNDGDGEVDEADESVVPFPVRAIAFDDAGYGGEFWVSGFPGSGNPIYADPITVRYDGYAPTTMLTNPHDGNVYVYGDIVNLTGVANDIPDGGTEDQASAIDYVIFQLNLTNDPNGWVEIDPTPDNNTDSNRIEPTTEGQTIFSVSFDTAVLPIRVDQYMRLRMLATDVAGNTTVEDDIHADEIVVILNDVTAPGAFLQKMISSNCDFCRNLSDAVEYANGVVTFYGTVTTPTADELAALAGVDIVLTPEGGDPVVLGRATLIDIGGVNLECQDGLSANTATSSLFTYVWDTDNGPGGRYQEGAYTIEARAVDTDGNAFTSLPASLVIRRTPPTLVYDPAGGRAFVNTAIYHDDGIVDHTSIAIDPDAYTGDVDFFVYTVDGPTTIQSLQLQWRLPGTLDWNTVTNPAFAYAPGSNIAGHHAWLLHAEDFVDNFATLLPEGPIEWRVLITDKACNTNANDGPALLATVDKTAPTGWDYTDNTNASQTAPGEEITFNVVLKDAITDVKKVQLYYIQDGDGVHHVIASTDDLPLANATDLDGLNTLWNFSATWAYPTTVYHNTPLEIHVYAEDVVGNWLDWKAADLTVRDEEAPIATKIQTVPAKVFFGFTEDKGGPDSLQVECSWIDLSPTTIEDETLAIIPNPDYGVYNYGVDWVVDDGGFGGIPNGMASTGFYGGDMNTFPRDVNEGFLYNTPAKTAKAAREVVVVARTRYGDNGIGGDTGVYSVTFYATPVDANGAPTGPAVIIGKDELANGNNLYYRWHVVWNLLETNLDGSPMWQGNYRLSARAMDEAGNIEVDPLLLTTGIISIDNVAPTADVTIVPGTTTVERNSAYTFLATTNLQTEDDVVEFYFKRHRDLNVEGSYHTFQNAWGTGPEDLNPDLTRPYSFDINLGAVSLSNPDEVDWPQPLAVGEQYDFVASVMDEVGNTTSEVGNFDRNGYVTVTVVDTQAPVMTIIAAKREAPGNTVEIRNPDVVRARAFEYIAARNLDGDLDLDHAMFLFREKGTTGAWTLIDAALTEDHATGTWQINHWDLRTLTNGATYEVAVVGVDDVGNTTDINDPAATPRIDVIVDYTAPDNYAMTQPAPDATDLCGWYFDGQNKIYDLAVRDQDAVENVDTWKVVWYYKAHVDTSWVTVEETPIHDDRTNTWMERWGINSLGTDLYDVDAQVTDTAGNSVFLGPVERLALDVTPPTDVAITNITDGTGAQAFVFHPNGLTDISTGVEVRLWGSAKDDEVSLPADRETPVTSFQFMVSVDESNWQDLGTVEASNDQGDPTDYAASVIWNTTGIPEGTLLEVKVIAYDSCGNHTDSASYEIKIVDITPPSARIIAFDPDLETHGEDPETCVKIYAVAESDPDGYDVVHFQYDAVTSDTDTDTTWVNIGVGEELDSGDEITQALWVTSVRTNSLPTALHYRLRALVQDDAGNISIKNAPTLLCDLVTLFDGKITFSPVRTTVPAVETASIQIESPTIAVLTVKMSNATDRPRVVVLGEPFVQETDTANICDPDDIWAVYAAGVDMDDDYKLVRSLDDPTVWRGQIYLDPTWYGDLDNIDEDCISYTIWVSGADNKIIDLVSRSVHEYPVSQELGTNGTVVTPGYTDLYNKATIRSGAWQDDACLLVSQTIPPSVSTAQSMYLTPVDESAYHMELLTDGYPGSFTTGYFPTVTIKYSDAALAAALATTDGVTEDMLTVRRWNPNAGTNDPNNLLPEDGVGYWTGAGISKIHVNAAANEIHFEVDNLTNALGETPGKSDESYSAGNVFQVFVPKSSAPVFVYNVTPHSEYLSTWMTDADPIFNIYLNDVGGQGIDPSTVKVKIDGRDVATYFGSFGDGETHDIATWTWGAGESHLSAANAEMTVWELDYWHSPLQRDWLTQGDHTLTVEFGYDNGTSDHFVSDPIPFSVDLTAPIIEFHGGWVSNPLLHNVSGYVDANNSMLTVKMTDHESGIFVRPQRQEFLLDPDCDGLIDGDEVALNEPFTDPTGASCFNPIDWGIHYDLWRVDGEDEQADIDEFEERELLHQGTADELLPYLTPPLYGTGEIYDPSKDLFVKLPIVGGGRIQDGDILEVTIYSQKTRTLLGEGPALGCDQVDTLTVNGQTMYILGGCWFDFLSQQRIIYQQGVVDQVRNSGSQYVEQRFIVDMTAPNCAINLPGATQDPASPMLIDVSANDGGVGMGNEVTVKVYGPNGDELEIQNVVVNNGHFTGTIPAPLATGDYTITTTARDKLGHVCSATKTVRVEAPLLTLTDVYSYPNPFDPASGDAVIHFTLSKTSDVTIKVYDFAGNFVTTLKSHETMSPSSPVVRWGGTTNDGTRCANGAYIVRVTATDGARTEESNLKVVIWRE